jgi:hypothetical protein
MAGAAGGEGMMAVEDMSRAAAFDGMGALLLNAQRETPGDPQTPLPHVPRDTTSQSPFLGSSAGSRLLRVLGRIEKTLAQWVPQSATGVVAPAGAAAGAC